MQRLLGELQAILGSTSGIECWDMRLPSVHDVADCGFRIAFHGHFSTAKTMLTRSTQAENHHKKLLARLRILFDVASGAEQLIELVMGRLRTEATMVWKPEIWIRDE